MYYSTNEFRKGLRIDIDGDPYIIVDHEFRKPGKGQAFTKIKIKHLINGNVIERTYKSGEKVQQADVQEVNMQFLYNEGEIFHFMNMESYEQIEMNQKQLDDQWKWLQDNMEVTGLLYKGTLVSITLPNFSILEITYCEPGVRGDTATNVTKPATLSTGATINVPIFINQGDKIKIDTRTGEYSERVK